MATSRNQPCPCGSGKKFKRCCGAIKKSIVANTSLESDSKTPSAGVPVARVQSLNPRTYQLKSGVKISAPDSIELLTPYVLLEQQDWFEDEIDFVREFFTPGMNAIDIGANYGIYTYTLAKQSSGLGKIWAFEPTSKVMTHLQYSKQLNLANNVELVPCALSDRCGKANFSLNQNPEFNQIADNNDDSSNSDGTIEEVTLRTLDDFFDSIKSKSIDFIKLDAEGEEVKIIEGGKQFFEKYSPLVMYERVHAGQVNETLREAFDAVGYSSYRLIKGLNVLIPLEKEQKKENFLLNLFACNAERALQLEKQGLLIRDLSAVCEMPNNIKDYLATYYHTSPVAASLADSWSTLHDSDLEQVNNILAFYMMAQDTKLAALTRYKALQTAYVTARESADNKPSYSDLSTYARTAADFGERREALEATQIAAKIFNETRTVEIDKPLLAATAHYDTVNPGQRSAEWLLSSIMEADEKLRHWSSYYTGDSAMQNLMVMKDIGFWSEEMQRRVMLIEQRYLSRTQQAS